MSQDQRNMIIAVVLSLIVVFGWQFFVVGPQMEQQIAQQQALQEQQQANADLGAPTDATGATTTPQIAADTVVSIEEAIAGSAARVAINSASLLGTINLTGARIDDLSLKNYHETVDDSSPIIHLLAPANTANGYYLEQGWLSATGNNDGLPNADTVWTAAEGATLTEATPLVLTWENGLGLTFERTIAIDEHYLFTVTDKVSNQTSGDVVLYPYSRVTRVGIPDDLSNYFILHEGPIGVMGGSNLLEKSYGDVTNDVTIENEAVGGWLGFTDKYWATAIMPEDNVAMTARFVHTPSPTGGEGIFRANYVERDAVVVPAGGVAQNVNYMFAGAKVESIIDQYEREKGFDAFELLIDWGWFHFITKPMFYLIRFLNSIFGNFGLAILGVTLIIKLILFPLANRSYASMAKMRNLAPKQKEIQERHGDDKAAAQKEIMELFQKEKINPLSGCWPMLIQIPIFFSLYKVLFVTIEMRQAPFFGWIQDLAAKDPTNIFNLFGLIPYDPTLIPVLGGLLHLGIWPLVMGISMWVQMRLNPPPTDPSQAMIFNLMPIFFTFMLGTFPAGLVIYWAWNNILSIAQQYFIMKRHGSDVNLLGNIAAAFRRKRAE